jgi:hypothetical protein
MVYQISEAAKKRAAKCPYNFEGLNSEKWDTCSIEKELSGALLIKDISKHKFCNYFLYFGSRHICICPIRYEIYKRYGR